MSLFPNTVINLHDIQSTKWLNCIFESLKKNYHIIRAEDLEDYFYKGGNLDNVCHITFDDGHVSFYDYALPLIRKHKIPVSIYVSPLIAVEGKNFWFQEIKDYRKDKLIEVINKVIINKNEKIQPISIINFLKTLRLEVIWEIIRLYQKETNTLPKTPMNMNVNQLIEVRNSGLVEIGAHTLNHPLLKNEDRNFVINEIERSIDYLSEILDSEIKYFAYPNGRYGVDFSDREVAILKTKGIRLAFSTDKEIISNQKSPYLIPRNGSPFVSESIIAKPYIYSKFFFQILIGEKNYYKYAKAWGGLKSQVSI